MKIAYYMPFKPMGHHNPSGDLIIGTEIYDFLEQQGADIYLVSRFRCRWLYYKPHLWPVLLLEIIRVLWVCKKKRPDIWLTYHSYYKAPDILGSVCSKILGIPYVIFQGIYSTKRRKSSKTVVGFHLNRLALLRAECIFTNKKSDQKNLERLVPVERVQYIPPGLHPQDFCFDIVARERIRKELQANGQVVIMTAAMFRPGVKTEGILTTISSCQQLVEKNYKIMLIIAGDGSTRQLLEKAAQEALNGKAIFLGRLERKTLANYYSGADIFAFPGIEESLGMVYLEAQACRLPVVAYGDWGAKEAVRDHVTGLLSPATEQRQFTDNLEMLVEDRAQRKKMGLAATAHVKKNHNIGNNYSIIWKKLQKIQKCDQQERMLT